MLEIVCIKCKTLLGRLDSFNKRIVPLCDGADGIDVYKIGTGPRTIEIGTCVGCYDDEIQELVDKGVQEILDKQEDKDKIIEDLKESLSEININVDAAHSLIEELFSYEYFSDNEKSVDALMERFEEVMESLVSAKKIYTDAVKIED